MSTNEDPKDQKSQEAPKEGEKSKNPDGKPEYKGNNPGGAASKE